MKELQTILKTDIPKSTRGILYLCVLDRRTPKLEVVNEMLFNSAFAALQCYANIPNPESQLVMCNSDEGYNELIKELHILHKNMKDLKWLEQLMDCI